MRSPSKRSIVRVLLLFGIGFLFVIGIIWRFYPNRNSPSYTGKIERRDYNFIVSPLDGTSLNARLDRIKHRIDKPGQVKLMKLFTSGTPPKEFQSALEKYGYRFPPGTEVVSHLGTAPSFYIRHYPEVLDSLEAEFQLEQRW